MMFYTYNRVDMGVNFISRDMAILLEKLACFRTDVIVDRFIVPSVLFGVPI